jgi:hypothetical protein
MRFDTTSEVVDDPRSAKQALWRACVSFCTAAHKGAGRIP